MKKLMIPIIFACLISFQTFGQDVTGMETFPAKSVTLYQEFDSYQLDETFTDKVGMTELKINSENPMPIAVPPLGNYVSFRLKKLRVSADPGLPAYECKGKLTEAEELLYPERTFYIILPEKKIEK
ncbi:MAG TPA: hypothetical protein VK957_22765 [Lunatimonas sp.]|nr:hypothetical protein [Lunatimonas sp.]